MSLDNLPESALDSQAAVKCGGQNFIDAPTADILCGLNRHLCTIAAFCVTAELAVLPIFIWVSRQANVVDHA